MADCQSERIGSLGHHRPQAARRLGDALAALVPVIRAATDALSGARRHEEERHG